MLEMLFSREWLNKFVVSCLPDNTDDSKFKMVPDRTTVWNRQRS